MNLLCVFDAMILAAMGAGAEPAPLRKKPPEGADTGQRRRKEDMA